MVVALAMANNGLSSPPPPPAPPVDYIENGRLYHGFRKGKYMLPIDEDEKDRMDIFHKFFLVARDNQLHSVKFIPNYDGPRVLDLGTGTGIWGIDMADEFDRKGLKGDVVGVDLAMIQPAQINPNISFHQRDIESPWHGLALESWDMIHIRMLAGSIGSWPELYQKVYRHLKPGYGWLEHVEIDFHPRCDDGSLPQDSAVNSWIEKLYEATRSAYRPLAYNSETRAMLERQGFVDIQEQVIKIPLNPWPSDPAQKDIARWYNLALTQGLEAMTLAPMSRVFGWPKDDVERLVAAVKREICSRKVHVYNNIHIWTARRPLGP
ncbi:Secondary metabolism regulator lae1 [Clarireedia jacksonii]